MAPNFIPYASRSGWEDIEPLAQADAQGGLVQIMYDAEYNNALSTYRAIVVKGEKSMRVLDLTEHVIRLNPAHYTVWQYRVATLKDLSLPFLPELHQMTDFTKENLKSYQVWHHRLTLLTLLANQSQTPSEGGKPVEKFGRAELWDEIAFVHDSFLRDAKNYHTWAYLHWIFSYFFTRPDLTVVEGGEQRMMVDEKDVAEEIKWCELMLGVPIDVEGEFENDGEPVKKGDGRNNSAWHWRWYLMVERTGAKKDKDQEVKYTLDQIKLIPHNASAWNYLRGIHKHFSIPYSTTVPHILSLTTGDDPVPHAVEWLADANMEDGKFDEAAGLYQSLEEKWDRMRKTYWKYKQNDAIRKGRTEKI